MDAVQKKYPSQSLAVPDRILQRHIYTERPEIRIAICKLFSFLNDKDKCEENFELLENRDLAVHITSKLLANDCGLVELSPTISKKIKQIEHNYKNGMEEFWIRLSKWLKTRRDTIHELQRTEQTFRLIHRTTAGLTFLSSTIQFVTGLGLLLKNVLPLKMDLPLIIPVLNGISITSSILALSHSRAVLEDIVRELREDKRQQKDLERVYKNGEWVDKAVQDLFPFGIDTNLLKDPALLQQSWRKHVCSAIILTNIKKDIKILDDQEFLPTVKAFVNSPAAEIWLNRMKLRKLLDTMSCKCETSSDKGLVTSSTEVFLNRAAINLYPAIFPLFTKTGNTEKMRFLFSSIAVVITALDLADSGHDEFQEMKDTILALKDEYGKIRKMNNSLISDYD